MLLCFHFYWYDYVIYFKDLSGLIIADVLGDIIMFIIIYFYYHFTKTEQDLFEHGVLLGLIVSLFADFFLSF